MQFMIITNNVEHAKLYEECGVDIIFVDLEKKGKLKRQGHLNTHISNHKIDDVGKINNVLDKSELLVRVNPINEESQYEIDQVIDLGADIIMLPMFKTLEEVDTFIKYVNNRAKTILLLETPQALVRLNQILHNVKVDSIHIGLNDLHISMGLDFMFELLSGGIIEYAANIINQHNIKWGFGGIAMLNSGMLPAKIIVPEHVRLKSSTVILSREFKNIIHQSDCRKNAKNKLKASLNDLREYEMSIKEWSISDFERNKKVLNELVQKIVEK